MDQEVKEYFIRLVAYVDMMATTLYVEPSKQSLRTVIAVRENLKHLREEIENE